MGKRWIDWDDTTTAKQSIRKPCAYFMGYTVPDNKVHGANMGPIWGRQDPGGPHVCRMNFAIWCMIANSKEWTWNKVISIPQWKSNGLYIKGEVICVTPHRFMGKIPGYAALIRVLHGEWHSLGLYVIYKVNDDMFNIFCIKCVNLVWKRQCSRELWIILLPCHIQIFESCSRITSRSLALTSHSDVILSNCIYRFGLNACIYYILSELDIAGWYIGESVHTFT